jgi:hypothetical protein
MGTVSINGGSTSLAGSSTAWLSSPILAGWFIKFAGTYRWYQVQSITSDVAIVLATQYVGPNLSGVGYVASAVVPMTIQDVMTDYLATLPTTLPTDAGVLWNDNGVLSISQP